MVRLPRELFFCVPSVCWKICKQQFSLEVAHFRQDNFVTIFLGETGNFGCSTLKSWLGLAFVPLLWTLSPPKSKQNWKFVREKCDWDFRLARKSGDIPKILVWFGLLVRFPPSAHPRTLNHHTVVHYITNWPYIRSQTFSVRSNRFLRLKCTNSRVWAKQNRLLVPLNNGPPTKRSRTVLICGERISLFFCKGISSNRQIVYLSFLDWWVCIARCTIFFLQGVLYLGGYDEYTSIRSRMSISLALSVSNQLPEN